MKFTKTILALLFTIAIAALANASCETWNDSPQKNHLEEQHSVYRGFMKIKNYASAMGPWKEVYEAAPAADGKRGFHYTDGIIMYKDLFDKETDEAKKKEYAEMVLRLYDEAIECYQNRSIWVKGDSDEVYASKVADLYSRKSYEMYYTFQTPYSRTFEALQYAIDIGGEKAPYTVIVPYANITVYQFLKEQIDAETARNAHDEMIKLADLNIANGHEYAAYYKQGKEAALGEFKKIELQIFDCAYFKEKWLPDYEDNSDDPYFAKDLYNKLKRQGCMDEDEFLVKLKTQFQAHVAAANAAKQAEFEANNPSILARKCYESGDYNCAISKYRDAIASEDDPSKIAKHHFAIASILFRKLNKYSEARKEALTAAEVNPSWGRPYVLIGDIYAKAARGCGDSWNQSLAILAAHAKWSYANSKDLNPSIQSNVKGKLAKYREYFPSKDEGFMRGAKPGSKASVGCWIGESVTIKYK